MPKVKKVRNTTYYSSQNNIYLQYSMIFFSMWILFLVIYNPTKNLNMEDDSDGSDQNEFFLCDTWNANQCDNRLPTFSIRDGMKGLTYSDVYMPGRKYQVLWLLHGGTGDDSDYLHYSNIARYAEEHKLAVVMPADYNALYTDDQKAPNTLHMWQMSCQSF